MKSMRDKLRDILAEFGHNQNDLANLLGISYQSVSIKINGKKDFTRTEIFKIKYFYKLSNDEVCNIFFSLDDMIINSRKDAIENEK